MKKKIILATVAVAAVICAAAAFSGMGYEEPAPAESLAKENCYVLRDYEGYVAVFVENDPSVPTTVTDIQTSTLRQVDRQTLKTGLKVVSQEKLMMMLEDLGS